MSAIPSPQPEAQAAEAAEAADPVRHLARVAWAESRAAELSARYAGVDGLALVRVMIETEFPGRVAATSSFGAEAAVMLDLVAQVDPATPVIFLDTRKLFGETLRYRGELRNRLGLADLRVVGPTEAEEARLDPDGVLWRADPDACCRFRKVVPLARSLAGFDAWFTGRKRFHGGSRTALPTIEADGGRVKVNPLATWSREDIVAHFAARGLPAHPLVADGYSSIGCMPCTDRPRPGGGLRDGRWAGSEKTECGIHEGPLDWPGSENLP
jgi:phosphoadenosine phosphosulfate reductase